MSNLQKAIGSGFGAAVSANDMREDYEILQVGSMSLGVMPYAVDPKSADLLWSLSERLAFAEERRL